MKLTHKVLIAAVAVIGIAIPMATPAFASTIAPSALVSQSVLTGCVTSAQLQAAAALAITNWASNEATLGTSTPAGVTVNGDWFPANLLNAAPLAVAVFTCQPPAAPATEAVFNASASESVLTGCVAPALLQAAAALAIANWGINEATFGTSTPAGVTVNGQWFPASLLLSGVLPVSTVSCPQG
jgi:type II secretory pathway pseudopilin PulG